MARIKGKNEFVETVATTTVTPPLPEHVAGDLLLVFAVADNVVTAFDTTGSSSGWTIGGQSQSPGTTTSACRAGWFYKIAESADELLTLNSASTTWAATALCIEEAHTTTPIDASNGDGITIAANPGVNTAFAAASITTTSANTLVFYTMFNSLSASSPFPGIRDVSGHDTGSIGLGIGMIPQAPAGDTGTWDFYTENHTVTTQNSVSFTIAIKDAASPTLLPAYLNKTHASMITPLRGITASVRGETVNATNTNLYTNIPAFGRKQSKKVFQYDDSTSTFYDVTTAANDNTTGDFYMLNNSPAPANDDYIAFCMDTPFPSLSLSCNTTGAGGAFLVEFWNGSVWNSAGTVSTTLTCWKYWVTTTLTNLITAAFSTTAITSLYLSPATLRSILAKWKSAELNGVTGYWMRIRWTTAPTTNPRLNWMVPSEGICIYDAFAALADSGGNPFHNSCSSTASIYSATVSGMAGTYMTLGNGIAPFDPTGKLIVGCWTFGTARDIVDCGARSELAGSAISFLDSSWNDRMYFVGAYQAKDTYQNERNIFAIQWDATTKTYNEFFNPVTTISAIALNSKQIRGTGAIYWNQCVAYDVPILCGGTATNPITNTEFLNTFAMDYYYPIPLIRNGSCVLPIQFGGSDPLFIELDTLLLSFPRLTTEPDAFAPAAYVSTHIDPDYLGLIFRASGGDIIKLTNSVIYSESSWRFEMSEYASPGATWDFTGTAIINATVTLQNVTIFDSMTFAGCPSINASESTLTNCKITNVPSTNDSFIVTA